MNDVTINNDVKDPNFKDAVLPARLYVLLSEYQIASRYKKKEEESE